VVQGGPANGRAFVFVHGIGVSHRYFLPLLHELAQTDRVIGLDLPGFGWSSRPDHALDVGELADVVWQYLEVARLEAPLLVGHSMGCQIISELVRRHPATSARLLLLAPTVDGRDHSPLSHARRLMVECSREPLRLNRIVFADYLRGGVRRYLATLRYMFADHIEDRLVEQHQYVIAVARGQYDPIVDAAWGQHLAKLCGRPYYEIPNAGHAIQWTKPREVAALCRSLGGG